MSSISPILGADEHVGISISIQCFKPKSHSLTVTPVSLYGCLTKQFNISIAPESKQIKQ